MKRRPILFTGEMVRAIIAGQKTMTRRVIKPQFGKMWGAGVRLVGEDRYSVHVDIPEKNGDWKWLKCPYGKAGDELWVRETWKATQSHDDCSVSKTYIRYRADDSRREVKHDKGGDYSGPWRPSIYMPQWASRITLAVESIDVQRLQDITAEDCKAEGSSEGEFRRLWDEINAARGFPWHSNPWLWVVTFSVVEVKRGGKDGNEDNVSAGLKTFR